MVLGVALLAASCIHEFEIVMLLTVLFAMGLVMYRRNSWEPYADMKDAAMPTEGYEEEKEEKKEQEPVGVYDPKIEGFADASTLSKSDDKKEEKKDKGESKESNAAPTMNTAIPSKDMAEAVKAVMGNMIDTKKPADASNAAPNAAPNANAVPNATPVKSGFQGTIEAEEFQSATNGLFKLGKMPSEHSEGPKLDAGKTLMKAMSSFDPSTISAMTTDTKKLLETQKGLMQMLTQMRPVLADGKELLQTFSGMFGSH